MKNYFALPAPQMPSNALINFDGLNSGLNSLGTKMQYREEQNRADEERRYQRGRQAKADGIAAEDRADARQLAVIKNTAGVAQMVDQEQDPTKRQAMWRRFIGSDKRFGESFAKYGMDPTDYMQGPKFLIAQARGYQEPAQADVKEVGGRLVRVSPDGSQAKEIYAPSGESATGPYKDMKQKADVEESLRKEVAKTNSDYATIRDAEAKIEALGNDSSAGADIALIYSYMKTLDPGSVVRETEYATAQNATGVPDQVRNVWNRVLSGERLNPAQRADFVKQAKKVAATQRQQYERSLTQYEGVAKRLQVDPRNVILDLGHTQARQEAQDAIRKGADPARVRQRLIENGIDPAGL